MSSVRLWQVARLIDLLTAMLFDLFNGECRGMVIGG